MTWPSWLGRAARNRHRHAIEQASRRWRGGRRYDSARTRRKILISTQVLGKLGAPGVGKDDEEASAATLADYDGFLFGLPTRFGMAPAQVKALLDSTGGLWQKGALVGKPAGVFFSTGTQNGGQETTALTFVTQLTHHGMVFVPLGYSTPKLFDMDAPHGGSPYGAGTLAGPDGSRQPSALEKDIAEAHGEHFGTIAAKLAK